MTLEAHDILVYGLWRVRHVTLAVLRKEASTPKPSAVAIG